MVNGVKPVGTIDERNILIYLFVMGQLLNLKGFLVMRLWLTMKVVGLEIS